MVIMMMVVVNVDDDSNVGALRNHLKDDDGDGDYDLHSDGGGEHEYGVGDDEYKAKGGKVRKVRTVWLIKRQTEEPVPLLRASTPRPSSSCPCWRAPPSSPLSPLQRLV